MRLMFIARIGFVPFLLSGCHREDLAACAKVRERFREVRDDLNAGGFGVRPVNEAGAIINGWISCVSNADLRIELSLELARIVLSVNLTNQPYIADGEVVKRRFPRQCVTSDYPRYINAVCWIMKENGCPPESELDFFFNALQKFREACFSVPVPVEWKRPLEENREDFIARADAAWKLHGSYSHVMSYVRRFVLPKLSNYLPEELHDEFRRRIEPFFEYPSKEEFYKMMHPGCNHPYPLTATNAASERPDVEVEIPGEEACSSSANR